MKKLFIALVFLSFIFSCEEKPKNPVAVYGGNLMNAYEKGKQAGEDANLDAVRKAVRMYHASNEKFPRDLEEIKSLMGGSDIDCRNMTTTPNRARLH